MTSYWQPTATGYFGRVSKERIVEAVREGVSGQAADNIAHEETVHGRSGGSRA
jgi:ParB family chromosome partitioning protein